MIQQIDYFVIAPPLVLALAAGLVLLLDAFLPARRRAIIAERPGPSLPSRSGTATGLGLVTLAGILVALGFVVAQALGGGSPRSTFCVPPGLAGSGTLCSFVADGFTLVFAGMVLVAAVVIVLMSMTELAGGAIPVGEWYFLLLCTLVGAVTLPASRDLIMLVVALELVSLPVFALTALKRYDGRSSEAAVKLFVVSVVSTAIMLFGVSLLYGIAGSVYLSRLREVFGGQAMDLPAVVTVGVVLVVAGFAFKIAAVPFHSWAADVYQGAPVPVAALLSVISKAAGFAGLILVLVTALSGQAGTWAPIVAILSALTMTAGNLLAMRQRSAVRLLAWSSVAQSGYILAPLAVAATAPGAVGTSMAYLVIYAAMNLGAFAVVMLVSRAATRNELDDYRGLALRRPAAGVTLAFCLVCLAGLPPGLAGLFAKVFVFREIVGGGAGWLAVVMAVNTVIGLYYYAVWTARLFTPAGRPEPSPYRPPLTAWLAVGLALAAAVLFSVAPQLVLDLTSLSASG
ncbi:NADH-ubiquinone oxidoreductase chain N [[Actinomadura] parvosata subsp. kistnae]|uniref:NADH-quinone oxidoreductase subunit N n=1 Tax=[Actinomadura] parvosata subsp. kistnae TaxID=1909395 RepID=A0A1V0AAL5_9ACTN|nr:NADH-quinone oxidoreductase subunit N [Nonomuraea sp. ATCC 55076]AQZ67260.1 NADH-quinone oxidoreductase subunit N [Nonomuraea sp. ATCC 55076]SPL94522.1 NADH-ubiquinone oxidoreductase chain N [Actinomadura parvosata subsp. kistnae]